MPLPKPSKGQTKDDWMERCMGNPVMNKEFPDNSKRSAVCNNIWNKTHTNGCKDDK